MHTIAAVVTKEAHDYATTQVILLDLLGVARGPSGRLWLIMFFILGSSLNHWDWKSWQGSQLLYEEGASMEAMGHRRVQDGELIEVALRRTDAITPSPAQESSETENSGDGDGDETSEAEDPLPDSSDFSTEGPTGAGPWGPPPPQPVNRERSRTPTRHQGLQPIELANLRPVPSYDLTVDTLQLPSIPETWKSCPKLWDLDWLNLQRLPLKTATKQALQEAVTW